jgi:hypothetical protein
LKALRRAFKEKRACMANKDAKVAGRESGGLQAACSRLYGEHFKDSLFAHQLAFRKMPMRPGLTVSRAPPLKRQAII